MFQYKNEKIKKRKTSFFYSSKEYFPNVTQNFISRILNKIPFLKNHQLTLLWSYPDSIYTPHNKSFITTSEFSKAYSRAIKAGEFDYRIPFRVHQVLWAVHSTLTLDESGSLVEIGTGKGFMMSAALESINDWNTRKNKCWLYDVFQQPEISKRGNIKYAKYYASSFAKVQENFSEWERVNIVEGDVYQKLLGNLPENIIFLHIDLNDVEAEIFAIRQLWKRIIKGAIIILDDYANRGHENQYNALNQLFSELERPILSTPSGQGIIIK